MDFKCKRCGGVYCTSAKHERYTGSVATRSVPTRPVPLDKSRTTATGSVSAEFVVAAMLQSRLTTAPTGTGTPATAAPLVGIGQLLPSTSRSCVVAIATATLAHRVGVMDTTRSVAGQDTPPQTGQATTGQIAGTFVSAIAGTTLAATNMQVTTWATKAIMAALPATLLVLPV